MKIIKRRAKMSLFCKNFVHLGFFINGMEYESGGGCERAADFTKLEVDQQHQPLNRKLTGIANLSITDEEFVYNVNSDIEHFLKKRHSNGVLLFPPVNNFRRFLIHQTCENFRNKYDLFTFSVGQGPFRRTVICFKSQLLDPYKYIDSAGTANLETHNKNSTSLKNWRSDNQRKECSNFSNKLKKRNRKMGVEKNIIDTNKINKSNPGDLYRTPSLRNNENEAIKKDVTENIEISVESSPSPSTMPITTSTSISCSNSPIHRNEYVNINKITTSIQKTTYETQQQYKLDEQQKQPQRSLLSQQVRRERRPDRAVYIPRARRSQTTPPNTLATQIQSPQQLQQHQALSTQIPVRALTATNHTSKNLSQQLAITSDDTTAALVKQKPSVKADEINKTSSSGVSIYDNVCNTNTILKKKEKLNNDSREQRKEQRSLRKSSTSAKQTHNCISENNKKFSENSIITKSKSNEIYENHCLNQEFTVNNQQIDLPSVTNIEKYFLCESNKSINLSKSFNCEISDNQELLDSNIQDQSLVKSFKQESNNSVINDNFNSNKIEIHQCINKPILFPSCNINRETCTTNDVMTTNIVVSSNNNNNTMSKSSNKTKSSKLNSDVYNNTKMPNLCIETIESQQSSTKCDIEEEELQRASKEINRSNRRIIKQTFVSDVLQIPDYIDEEEECEDKSKTTYPSNTTARATLVKTQFDSNTEEEEDDWENIYNDSGDCLDPKIMQELTATVGKCKIELPKMDYSAYLTKQSILNEEEFPHVLEVSNFPVEFKNQDLLMVFSQYKESGFDIKWVDDTHALAVFSSSRIAAEVLTTGHPFVVLKPLAEATVESRLKAKKCAASLQPYRPRPETCAALARRLVTGALGVRLKTSAAERENEKRVLREAKERKLLAAKQRDEVWES